MVWQDILLAFANIIIGYALIPQVIKGFKDKKAHIALQTGTITSFGMLIITIVYFSLNLTFSWRIGAFNTIMWTILLIQSIKYKK